MIEADIYSSETPSNRHPGSRTDQRSAVEPWAHLPDPQWVANGGDRATEAMAGEQLTLEHLAGMLQSGQARLVRSAGKQEH
jgi:hypothetical protein